MEHSLDNKNYESHLDIEDIDKSWQEQLKIRNDILEKGGYQEYFNKLDPKSKSEAFRNPVAMVVACIDEGCTHHSHISDGPILNLAGSGILYSVEETVDLLKDKDIAIITSHDECGAASIANKDPYEYTATVVNRINEHRSEKGMSLVKHEHIEAKDMTRNKSFHEAIVIYYNFGDYIFDATRIVDNENNELFAKGFTIDRGHFNEENSLMELGVSIDIAFGGHGFGERFTEENPLIIVFVASRNDDEQERVLKYIKGRKEFQEGKIMIEYIENK